MRILCLVAAAIVLASCSRGDTRVSRHDCDSALKGTGRVVECLTLVVPEDWSEPTGGVVALEVAVVHAAARVEGLPPVIYLHGGPGGGVLDDLADDLGASIGAELIAQDQDWIFFDQRGSGRSRPLLDCGEIALNDAGPASDEVVAQLVACGRELAADGVDFSQYQSRNVAKDVQAIRAALGLDAFDLYGLSYGTRVAAAVLTHEPDGLRAIVYDSPWPPEAKWTEPGPGWVSREVRELLRACASDAVCRGHGDLERELDALTRNWLDGADTRHARALALFLMESLYDPDMVRSLPRTLASLTRGDLSKLAHYAASSGAGYAEALHMAVMCNEELPFESADAVRANAAGDPIAEAVALTMSNYFAACEGFGRGTPPPVEQQSIQSDRPALFLAAGIDAGCPAELSEAAVRGYVHGQLAIAPFTTHDLAANSACARRLARAFLRAPLRRLDISCIAVEAMPVRFE
jgi:pimeloyl-ACP methyl ester carboxylesterase